MRVVVQRVKHATVKTGNGYKATIGHGMVILAGIEQSDTLEDVGWLAKKISSLRIFDDEQGVMNRNVIEVSGQVLIVSQFTLHAQTRKGNRPSYIRAANPEHAIPLIEQFKQAVGELTGKEVKSGVFGAHMEVELLNDGPVTIIIDSKAKE